MIFGLRYGQAGDYSQAVKLGQQASAPRPEHLTPRALTAASFYLLGNARQAVDEASEVLKIVPVFSLRAADQIRYFAQEDTHLRLLGGLRGDGILEQ